MLVAGCSISALEIASDLAPGAANVSVAMRRQRYVLQKLLAGVPADHVAFTRFAAQAGMGGWIRRNERGLNFELSKLYGFTLDIGRMRGGVDVVAAALGKGELARAQRHCCCAFPILPRRRVSNTARCRNGVSPTTSSPAGF
ncbi:MAG TPA: hypothetical protein VGH40_23845 [Roseiarcus sp.]